MWRGGPARRDVVADRIDRDGVLGQQAVGGGGVRADRLAELESSVAETRAEVITPGSTLGVPKSTPGVP